MNIIRHAILEDLLVMLYHNYVTFSNKMKSYNLLSISKKLTNSF